MCIIFLAREESTEVLLFRQDSVPASSMLFYLNSVDILTNSEASRSCSSEVFSNPFTVQYLFERETSCSSALHLMASCILGFRDLSVLIFQFLEENQLFSENFAASVFRANG